MPGRTPQEAIDNFLDPLRNALNVLYGHSQILVNKRGGYTKDTEYAWVLCGLDGMPLPDIGTFYAEMRFKIVDADLRKYEAPLRVTTLGYRYRLETISGETRKDQWRIHWHPKGDSPYTEPHIHIPPDLNRHLTTGRITLEKVITWCIEYGARTTCGAEEAVNRLALCEAPHLLHRSWSDSPQEAVPQE